jgi:hypothetical protein
VLMWHEQEKRSAGEQRKQQHQANELSNAHR